MSSKKTSKITSKIDLPKSFKSIPGGLEPRSDHFAKDFEYRNKDSGAGLQNQILASKMQGLGFRV